MLLIIIYFINKSHLLGLHNQSLKYYVLSEILQSCSFEIQMWKCCDYRIMTFRCLRLYYCFIVLIIACFYDLPEEEEKFKV